MPDDVYKTLERLDIVVSKLSNLVLRLRSGVIFVFVAVLLSIAALGGLAWEVWYSSQARNHVKCSTLVAADEQLRTRVMASMDVLADEAGEAFVVEEQYRDRVDRAINDVKDRVRDELDTPLDVPGCPAGD